MNIKEPKRPTIEIVSEDIPWYLKTLLFFGIGGLFGMVVHILYDMIRLIQYQ